MDAPERLTRQYWNRKLKLQKISPERTEEFFKSVIGKYYTRPLNLYIGNDGLYYVYFPGIYAYNSKENEYLLDKTGVTKQMILNRETKSYRIFDEDMLRKALYDISCVSYDNIMLQDEDKAKVCEQYGPLYRESRATIISKSPIPSFAKPFTEKDELMFQTLTYGRRILYRIVSDEETNKIMLAIYGRTSENVMLMFDSVRGEYFIYEVMRSKNSYDYLQQYFDYDNDYLEKYVHICHKFPKPKTDEEEMKTLKYFSSGNNSIVNEKFIKTGIFKNMLIKSDNNNNYQPVSMDNLQKAYAIVLYNHRETW